ncbi:MAG: SRPBCC domain-containing protein [Solirubrobacteraceae bacterium]
MKLEQSFDVAAPLERVWAALIDVERVAPCLPGADVSGRNDDGSYNGTFKVKIGPTSAAYSGKLVMDSVDEATHTATMSAQGTDRRGQGGASATIISSVQAGDDSSSRVDVSTEYQITGRLARFGRGGMIEEIANRLLREFATSLRTMVAQTEAPPAVEPEVAAEVPVALEPEVATEVPVALEHEVATEVPVALEPEVATEVPVAPESEVAAESQKPEPPPWRPPPVVEPEPVQGLSLVGSALLARAKRNRVPLAALIVGFLVALRVLRRR